MDILGNLRGNRFTEISGILNGTTNYILTKMASENLMYEDVLKTAQELGFAEADPTSSHRRAPSLQNRRACLFLQLLNYSIGNPLM